MVGTDRLLRTAIFEVFPSSRTSGNCSKLFVLPALGRLSGSRRLGFLGVVTIVFLAAAVKRGLGDTPEASTADGAENQEPSDLEWQEFELSYLGCR